MRAARGAFSIREGIALSILTLAAGSFTVVGASANAPLIRAGLGLSEVGVGAIAAVIYFGAMVTSRSGGRATDRVGPTLVIVAGMAAMAAGSIVAALAPQPAVFYAGLLIAGLGYGVINPATNVLANPRTARRRGLVMSMKQAGVPLGGLIAGALLPAIGSVYGWRWAFVAPLLFCAIVATITAARARVRVDPNRATARIAHTAVRLRIPHGFVYGFVMAGAQVSIFAFTAVYLVEARDFSPSRSGLGISLLLLGGVVGRPFWGWYSDRYPAQRLRTLQVVSLLAAAAIGSLWAVPTVALPVALFVVGTSAVSWNGVYVTAVAEAGEPHAVGWTTGVSLTLINLGAVACPLLTGAVVQFSHSWVAGWLFCAAVNVCGFVVIAGSSVHPRAGAVEALP